MNRVMDENEEKKALETVQDSSVSPNEQEPEEKEQKIFDLPAVIRDKIGPLDVKQFEEMDATVQMLFLHLFNRVKDPRVPGRCRSVISCALSCSAWDVLESATAQRSLIVSTHAGRCSLTWVC